MAELFPGVDTQAMSEMVWNAMPSDLLGNFTLLMTLAKTIGILFIVYLAFLIIKAFVQTRQALRIKSIEQNVIAINEKLTKIIDKQNVAKHESDKKKAKT